MSNSVKTPQKTNALAVIGLVSAFFVPLVGLVLSIIGLLQINKKKEKGKGLAISGIVLSIAVGILQLLTMILIINAISNSSVKLTTYTNNEVGYSVKYPEGWTKSTNNTGDVKDVVFKDEKGETGKVYGQVEVVYISAPKNGYSKDVLKAIADAIVKDNSDTTVVFRERTVKYGRDAIVLVTTYKSEDYRIKAKTTIILNKDNSVYTISTQTPEKNWDKYDDAFDEIHNTFSP